MPDDLRHAIPTSPSDFVQIGAIWVVLYFLLRLVRGTVAGSILRGAVVVLAASIVLTAVVVRHFHLHVLEQILAAVANVAVLALLVVFQPELRRGLLSLGERTFLRKLRGRSPGCVEEIARAASELSRTRTGALVAIERNNLLHHISATGVTLDAEARAELFVSIFQTKSPLHDGGVVVRSDRVASAACIFPLADRRELASTLGTRHRAGIGLSEESDAVVVIVSEETGRVSVAVDGELTVTDPATELVPLLTRLLGGEAPPPAPGATTPATTAVGSPLAGGSRA